MLEEVYASRKPVRFEQIDVDEIVLKHFPKGTGRTAVNEALKASVSSKITKNAADELVVRDDRGRAMLDPDARSIVITFRFDAAGTLTNVKAIYLKSQ
ncbi:hypothetical protein ADU59_09185 [Pararhizobium polonicum]|uniref:Uncharacterized protein n=1 Tax=Pararhizobium polonicum TaxID=1612624 RepID=A0A1C7P3K5_9HYPH|nr:DUF6393 family protein [Pararhizobium polonicum]OBZ95852.1 hypothetical protein ADU59_09185 [Pararhizobium polonicum]